MIPEQVLPIKKVSPGWWLLLLLTVCFTLATLFVPRAVWWSAVPRATDLNQGQSQANNVFKLLLGEGRRLFANEFFVMADDYFHSGYYPSIFDRQIQHPDVAKLALGQSDGEDSTKDDFLGAPPDWIAALHRHFIPNRHTHLSSGGPTGSEKFSSVQQILPWLKLATDMNPQMIESYTVGAYWLRRLHKPEQALDFLFEGLRNNPNNADLLFNMGTVYEKYFHDSKHAQSTWRAALRCWQAQKGSVKTSVQAKRLYGYITMALAHQAQEAGDWPQAVKYLKLVKQVSPYPGAVQKQIDEARQKMTSGK